ncbi:M20/M25/M40 family metallo-hydrolase, partial [Anoxybacillus sp. LAT_38]|nr:M20/M25/M40 family metallo-hydrolase [Anoxybacillus sp. LAT_38]
RLSGGFTGVVGILDSGRPGPTVAFRVDMDALDLQESADADHLPAAEGFASVNANMMHACGHDAHTAIGLGLAYVLSRMKGDLHGRVKLIFQPAEEGV